MTNAIVLREHGGPDTLRLEQVEVEPPGPGELRLRQTAIGVNFHDIYVRSGLYRTLPLPGIPGIEAVGVVEETGPEVSGFAIGDRIGYITDRYGAYAAARNLPASLAVRLPDALDDRVAATLLLKGLTAEMLLRQVVRVEPGMTLLVHAAAGGVGRLLAQWGSHLDATVIGTAGSAEKAEIARAAGCQHVIRYRETDFVPEVERITGGRGVDVVYDAVGKETFSGSLAVLAWRGHLVNYGQASGPVAPLEMPQLAAISATVSRPIVFHYVEPAGALARMADAVFAAWREGIIAIKPDEVMPLAEAGRAHERLESRMAAGPIVLVPEGSDA